MGLSGSMSTRVTGKSSHLEGALLTLQPCLRAGMKDPVLFLAGTQCFGVGGRLDREGTTLFYNCTFASSEGERLSLGLNGHMGCLRLVSQKSA
eukprot:1158100-Pelagomonas_calceolata.AAC.5